ncbi:uncharacterized protein RJT20DRAFT_126019 [Scheffersomyces xylosifermentans]|uniref:uncharacterized protein n=1 Tax=Scheffersomyces xylosifermentans TaxID=1304137 RepID=UPI00315C6840
MITIRRQVIPRVSSCTIRQLSNESTKEGSKRFMRTIPVSTGSGSTSFYSGLNYSLNEQGKSSTPSKWASTTERSQTAAPIRRSRTSRFSDKTVKNLDTKKTTTASAASQIPSHTITEIEQPKYVPTTGVKVTTSTTSTIPKTTSTTTTPSASTTPKKKRVLRPRKALISLTPNAVEHLQALLNQPEPKLIRIGVRNRGCSGLTYNLEYVDKPGKFDELIEQDGVKVLIDSKALFSIVGSEMDWLDDKLSSRFIFKNPNSKGTCGCGESFMV